MTRYITRATEPRQPQYNEGKVRTSGMGGKDSTLDVAKAIADYAS
jgi:hypothetical protein